MAFTVEDGTIVTGANSFVSVSYADDYHADRGNATWTGTDAVKQAALVKATDYIEQKYSFLGSLVDDDQPLSWPRYIEGVDYNAIPDRLKQAVCILALESLSDDLNPTQDRAVKREKVDVIEVEYMDNATRGKSRPAVTGLLRPYIGIGAYSAKVIRT